MTFKEALVKAVGGAILFYVAVYAIVWLVMVGPHG